MSTTTSQPIQQTADPNVLPPLTDELKTKNYEVKKIKAKDFNYEKTPYIFNNDWELVRSFRIGYPSDDNTTSIPTEFTYTFNNSSDEKKPTDEIIVAGPKVSMFSGLFGSSTQPPAPTTGGKTRRRRRNNRRTRRS